jgi:broad specificity phosphatase PhoE
MEEKFKINLESKEKRFGANVQIHAFFVRHGEKTINGELTANGKNQAVEFGKELKNNDAVKGYSSPVQRALETVTSIVENSPHDKKLKTRIATELAIPAFSQQSSQTYKDLEKLGPDNAAEWYLSFGSEKPDSGTASPQEVARSFAYIIQKYIDMSDKLYSGSNIDLINGTHQGLPETLLKEILIREKEGKEIVGFKKLEDIGGALKPTEGMEFIIKTDDSGGKDVKLHFRNQIYNIDLINLHKLSELYETKKYE